MSHCLNTCELRDQLRSKETKINKLKRVLDHLESLESLEPHRRQKVEIKNSVINELIEKTLTEARHTGAKDATPTLKNKPTPLYHDQLQGPTQNCYVPWA